MTAWWISKEQNVFKRQKTDYSSFRKKWRKRRATAASNLRYKSGQTKMTPPSAENYYKVQTSTDYELTLMYMKMSWSPKWTPIFGV